MARLRHYRLGDTMVLDAATRAHLELFRNSEDGSRQRTLIERIDRSVTPLGMRRLARWLAYPLLDPAAVAGRQDAVGWLAERDRPRARLREALARGREDGSLVLIGRRQLRNMNSWLHNLRPLAKGRDRCTLLVSPKDAERLGLADGTRARVRSRVGENSVIGLKPASSSVG